MAVKNLAQVVGVYDRPVGVGKNKVSGWPQVGQHPRHDVVDDVATVGLEGAGAELGPWTAPAPTGSPHWPATRPITWSSGSDRRRAHPQAGPCGATTPSTSKPPSTGTRAAGRPGPGGAHKPTGPGARSRSPTGTAPPDSARQANGNKRTQPRGPVLRPNGWIRA